MPNLSLANLLLWTQRVRWIYGIYDAKTQLIILIYK